MTTTHMNTQKSERREGGREREREAETETETETERERGRGREPAKLIASVKRPR